MVRILLVEDERKLARSIERRLSREDYQVEVAFDGQQAQEMATSAEYGLIILDVNLPRKSGFEILKTLREKSYETPVIFLTARDQLEDRIRGLTLGADDYLVKPFDSSELIARVEAILRRSGTLRSNILEASDLKLDVVQRKVTRAGKHIELSPKEFALLEFFLRNKNQIITRRRLAEQIWGYTFDTGTNIVEVYVSYLRKAIDEGYSKKLIQTVRGEGFILAVQE